MHQSIPAAPIPPRATAGHLPSLSVPGVGHWQIWRGPLGRAFAYPGATPGLLTRMWFPTLNPDMEDFTGKDQQFGPLACLSKLRTGQTCGSFLDFMHLKFLHCLARHNLSYRERST